MVLGGLRDGLDLLGREPFTQARVLPDDAAALQMMRLAVDRKTEVMARRGRLQYVTVDVIGLPHRHGAVYDRAGMVFPVRLVKRGIARDDIGLNVIYK